MCNRHGQSSSSRFIRLANSTLTLNGIQTKKTVATLKSKQRRTVMVTNEWMEWNERKIGGTVYPWNYERKVMSVRELHEVSGLKKLLNVWREVKV